jgi:hypothetical protein
MSGCSAPVTGGDLAHWTGEAGDVVRAGELAATLIEDMVRTFGHDHPDTRAAQMRLAKWIKNNEG